MNRLFLLGLAGILFSGCASVAPFTSLLGGPGAPPPLQVQSQTSVGLAEDNFLVVRTNVLGQSKGFSLLGFITICPATLTKAMNQFYAAADLQSGRPQTLAHLVIERSSSYYVLFGIPEVEVRADIVEFRPKVAAQPPKPP